MSNLASNRAGRRVVHIEIEFDKDPVQGQLDAGDGCWRPFWGWLELMQAIEDAGEAPRATRDR